MALVGGLRRDGLRRALLCADDPRLRRAAERLRVRAAGPGVLTCGVGGDAELRAVIERVGWDGVTFRVEPEGPVVRLAVPGGRHLVASALLALAAAREVGVPLGKAAAALRKFRPADGRFHVTRARRVLIVDDTYNANPTSLGASRPGSSCSTLFSEEKDASRATTAIRTIIMALRGSTTSSMP